MFVRLETLILKNQKFQKSIHNITRDHNPNIILNFFDEIEESVQGHFCAA